MRNEETNILTSQQTEPINFNPHRKLLICLSKVDFLFGISV